VILVAGCGGNDDPEETPPAATPLPTATPTEVPAFALGDVVWALEVGEDGAPVEPVTAFPRDAAQIFALVDARNIPEGETLSAVWTLDDVPVDGADASVTIDEATASGWVSYSLTWNGEALWPVGTLGITITSNSGATATGTIQIEST
jgi:hypothetical protein